jgi:hypothetical protein
VSRAVYCYLIPIYCDIRVDHKNNELLFALLSLHIILNVCAVLWDRVHLYFGGYTLALSQQQSERKNKKQRDKNLHLVELAKKMARTNATSGQFPLCTFVFFSL